MCAKNIQSIKHKFESNQHCIWFCSTIICSKRWKYLLLNLSFIIEFMFTHNAKKNKFSRNNDLWQATSKIMAWTRLILYALHHTKWTDVCPLPHDTLSHYITVLSMDPRESVDALYAPVFTFPFGPLNAFRHAGLVCLQQRKACGMTFCWMNDHICMLWRGKKWRSLGVV